MGNGPFTHLVLFLVHKLAVGFIKETNCVLIIGPTRISSTTADLRVCSATCRRKGHTHHSVWQPPAPDIQSDWTNTNRNPLAVILSIFASIHFFQRVSAHTWCNERINSPCLRPWVCVFVKYCKILRHSASDRNGRRLSVKELTCESASSGLARAETRHVLPDIPSTARFQLSILESLHRWMEAIFPRIHGKPTPDASDAGLPQQQACARRLRLRGFP